MAKLALLLASFALFILLANASIYRTTIEIDEDLDKPQQSQCRKEFQKQQQLRACQRYLRQQVTPDDVEDDVNQRQSLRKCCSQLRQVDEECVCPVLSQALQQLRNQGQLRGEQIRQLHSAAENLPDRCNIPTASCRFGPSSY